MIRAARGNGKKIISVVNTLAASAAYWLAAQADEIVATSSGELGSVGVYMLHEDWSGWNEQQGIGVTYVKTPRFKAEGNPDEPLSDDTLKAWQADVEDIFVRITAMNRGPDPATLHLLPTIWFRNTWSWRDDVDAAPDQPQSATRLQ